MEESVGLGLGLGETEGNIYVCHSDGHGQTS